MPNKLKNIFSNEIVKLGYEVHFEDKESYEKFLKAAKIVQNKGCEVEVEGISSLKEEVINGEIKYTLSEQEKLSKTVIKPITRNIEIPLETKYGKKKILFKVYSIEKGIIYETDNKEIMYLKIISNKDISNFEITYKLQPEFAKTLKDIIESYSTTIKFIEEAFGAEEVENTSVNVTTIYELKKSFLASEAFFKRLYLVEQELQMLFEPSQIDKIENDEDELEKLEELYLLIVEKKVIRISGKINKTKVTLMPIKQGTNKLEVGGIVNMTFLRELEYTICGQKILIYTANLLSNAIIKEIKEDKDDDIKVLYGDTDSQPMYVSYTGFKTSDEAEQEMKNIIDNEKKYKDALTLNNYLKK